MVTKVVWTFSVKASNHRMTLCHKKSKKRGIDFFFKSKGKKNILFAKTRKDPKQSTTTKNHLQPIATIHNNLQWPKMIHNDQKPSSATHNHPQQSAMTQNDPQWPTAIQSKVYSDPQLLTTIHKNPQPHKTILKKFTTSHYDPHQSIKIQYIPQMP